jgi:LmbE family N-acetylglucosaminyl deacetylase
MPTDRNRAKPAALFLFAHQDDEFGVFQAIMDEHQKGRRVLCAYLTDGGFGAAAPRLRNKESLAVLGRLDVDAQDVYFAGELLAIPDAQLPDHMEQAAGWIKQWLSGFPEIGAIYVPAWEGGHHDHDALHAVTVSLAQQAGLLAQTRQFPLYTGYRCKPPWFRVLLPLAQNGAVEKSRISWSRRLRFLGYCLHYRSQLKTWLGLFPFVALHYLTSGTQALQPVSEQRTLQSPHDGVLYYEGRKFFTRTRMAARLSAWRDSL